MTILWLTVIAVVTLHTAWTVAHAVANKGERTAGALTPHALSPYVWGAVIAIALGQGVYLLLTL